jgi:hypothetical protein
LILYADDLFLTGDEKLADGYKRELNLEFEMKDLDLMGLKVWQRPNEIFIAKENIQ